MLLFLFILFSPCLSFNIDTYSHIIHRGLPETYYGFSVSLYIDSGKPWLIIGAPLSAGVHENLDKAGAVYKCLPEQQASCQIIPFDTADNSHIEINNISQQIEEKNGQWFGATIATSGSILMACAPRFVYFSYNYRRREPIGGCFISRGSFGGFTPLDPCRVDEQWGYHRLGSCQAGFSAAVSKNGYAFVGAVGAVYWQGKVFSYDLNNFIRPPSQTKEGSEEQDNKYLGYSIVTGNFSNSDGSDIAVGMPRGANLTGKVVIFTNDLKIIFNITGDIMGTYFGYSLTAVDINNDGLEDIIIGAPLYTKEDNKGNEYEHGRVYIAYQRKRGYFVIDDKLDGYNHRSRFGTAVASLADINRDSFGDIAVGAPFDGDKERGAVYIFNGGLNGIQVNYSQVIYASDFNEPGLKTFGFSLSGGIDIDRNGYTDLLIGAPFSDRAVYLRSRAIVNVTGRLKLSPEKITLNSGGCRLSDNSNLPCIHAEVCLQYDGYNVPDKMNFTYRIKVDVRPNRAPRAFLLKFEGINDQRIPEYLNKRSEKCERFSIYIAPNIRDKLSPIKVEVEYNLVDYYFNRYTAIKPILNNSVNNKLTGQIQIMKNCSSDSLCIPDLQLHAFANVDQYLIGIGTDLTLNVSISNKGEDAFEAAFTVEIPPDVQYVHTEGFKSCYPPRPEYTGRNTLLCELGNPMPSKAQLNFLVHLKPKVIVTAAPTFLFLMNVSSSNNEKNETIEDNFVQLSIPVRVKVDPHLSGASDPEQIVHNASESLIPSSSHADDWGYLVSHKYTVRNLGPSSIKSAHVTILWPTKTLNDQWFLYLLSNPHIDITYGAERKYIEAYCENLGSDIVDPLLLPRTHEYSSIWHPSHMMDDSIALDTSFRWNNSFHKLYNSHHIYRRNALQEKPIDEFVTLSEALSCGTSKCTKINCTINNLSKQSVTFTILSRLSKATIMAIGLNEFSIQSKLVLEIRALPYGVENNYIPPSLVTATTDVLIIGLDTGGAIPLWIILAAILIGLLLLMLVALALWKLGFFKRKRPPTSEDDNEPLSPNGYRGYRKGDTSL